MWDVTGGIMKLSARDAAGRPQAQKPPQVPKPARNGKPATGQKPPQAQNLTTSQKLAQDHKLAQLQNLAQLRKPVRRFPLATRSAGFDENLVLDRRVLLLLGFAVPVGLFYGLSQINSVGAGPGLADAQSPHDIAKAVLGRSSSIATTEDLKTVSVHYDISAWSLTRWSIRSTFQSSIIRMIPLMFERVPETQRIELVADNIFDTIQGREVRQPAMSVVFTRATAAKVPWKTVSNSQVVPLADKAWVTPTIGW